MYFPGSTLQQIEDLRKRVAALENPQAATDQNEYQNHTNHTDLVDILNNMPAVGYAQQAPQESFQKQTSASSGTSQSSYGVVSAAQAEQDRRIGEQARVSKEMLVSGPVDIQKKSGPTFRVRFSNIATANPVVPVSVDADTFSLEGGFVVFKKKRYDGDNPVAAFPLLGISSITKL